MTPSVRSALVPEYQNGRTEQRNFTLIGVWNNQHVTGFAHDEILATYRVDVINDRGTIKNSANFVGGTAVLGCVNGLVDGLFFDPYWHDLRNYQANTDD